MEKLYSVKDLMDRYQCSRQTAIRYLQQMEHQERPYMVRQSVLEAWDRSRTVMPPAAIFRQKAQERLRRGS